MSSQIRIFIIRSYRNYPSFSPWVQNVIVCNLRSVLSRGRQEKSIFKSFKLNWSKRAPYWLRSLFFCSSLRESYWLSTCWCCACAAGAGRSSWDQRWSVCRVSASEWQYLWCPLTAWRSRWRRRCCDITYVTTAGEGTHHTMQPRWSIVVIWPDLIWITCRLTSFVLVSELILLCKTPDRCINLPVWFRWRGRTDRPSVPPVAAVLRPKYCKDYSNSWVPQ